MGQLLMRLTVTRYRAYGLVGAGGGAVVVVDVVGAGGGAVVVVDVVAGGGAVTVVAGAAGVPGSP